MCAEPSGTFHNPARAIEKGSSEDLVYFDTAGWGGADLAKAERIRADLGFFVDGVMIEQPLSVEKHPGADG